MYSFSIFRSLSCSASLISFCSTPIFLGSFARTSSFAYWPQSIRTIAWDTKSLLNTEAWSHEILIRHCHGYPNLSFRFLTAENFYHFFYPSLLYCSIFHIFAFVCFCLFYAIVYPWNISGDPYAGPEFYVKRAHSTCHRSIKRWMISRSYYW